jgi:trehalose synthase
VGETKQLLQKVDVGSRSLEAYRGLAPDETLDAIREAAEALQDARVLHLNATPYGGGVSEMLRSVVPLQSDLGLAAEWKVISGDDAFFKVTKRIHNALQGAELSLSREERAEYEGTAERNAGLLTEKYDFVVVHDPQPVAILSFHGRGDASWIWRCHIDTSEPNEEIWAYVRDFLSDFDALIYTMPEFLPPDLPHSRVEVIPPAIDPLSPKNIDLPEETAREVLGWIGIEFERPLVTQVSRFDPWKDPLGVIEAYRIARENVPGLQLALAGSMAFDDSEGWDIHGQIKEASEEDPLIHVFTNITGVGNIEVNALQRLSQVCIQKSIREGFGLVVSEAMWKGTPVVAGRAGGIPLQMADGAGGILVDSVEECAEGIVALLDDRHRADELGRSGRERVREHFLLPRLLLNQLSLLNDVAEGTPPVSERVDERRDPVCGMVVRPTKDAPTETHDGRTLRFCSEGCREAFRASPERYTRQRVTS